jgi:hypothetical protein
MGDVHFRSVGHFSRICQHETKTNQNYPVQTTRWRNKASFMVTKDKKEHVYELLKGLRC